MSDPTVPAASEPAAPPAPTAPPTPPPAYAPPTAYTVPPAPAMNGMAIASFVTSLVLHPGVVAVILGHIAMSQIKKRGGGGKGFAIAGLIIGYVSIAIAIVLLVAWIIAAVTLGAYSTYS